MTHASRYTPEQREAALASAEQLGVSRAARTHGVSRSTLGRWRASLGIGGPRAGVDTGLRRRRGRASESHPIINLDARTLHAAITSAQAGTPGTLHDLYDDMRDRDDRVDTVCRMRILAIIGRPWVVEPPKTAGNRDDSDESRRAHELAARVAGILDGIRAGGGALEETTGGGWATALSNIADGILRGNSVNEIEWGVDRFGWKVPKRIHWRHPNRFVYGENAELRKRDLGDPHEGVALTDYGPDKFIVHAPSAGRAAYPMRRGVMLGMTYASMVKRAALKYWLKGAERWGQPTPIATSESTQQPGDDLLDEMEETLRNLSANGWAITWGGFKVEALKGGENLRADVYQELVREMNTAIATLGLGQNLSTEVQGGSYAAATAHEQVRADLHAADLAELDDTITQQLIAPICRYNAPGVPTPIYRTTIEQRGDIPLEAVLARVFSDDEYRVSLGHEPKPAGEGAGYEVAPDTPLAAVPGEGGTLIPFPEGGPTSLPTSTTSASEARAFAALWLARSRRLPSGQSSTG